MGPCPDLAESSTDLAVAGVSAAITVSLLQRGHQNQIIQLIPSPRGMAG